MLISNIPIPDGNPEFGLTAEGLTRLYANEWKVEASFKTKKRPILVENLFIKDPARAEVLIEIVNIAALVCAMIQVILRKGVDELSDDKLPLCGRGFKKLQRDMTTGFFIDSCSNCYIEYDLVLNSYQFLADEGDVRA